jgi:hypothetical protein
MDDLQGLGLWCLTPLSGKVLYSSLDRISGVMVSMLVSSAVDHGFKPWSGQTKD